MMIIMTITRPYDSRNISSSERGTIKGVTAVEDGTAAATMPSYSRDRPPSHNFTDKQASPYQ